VTETDQAPTRGRIVKNKRGHNWEHLKSASGEGQKQKRGKKMGWAAAGVVYGPRKEKTVFG